MFNGICSPYMFSDMIDNQSILKWYTTYFESMIFLDNKQSIKHFDDYCLSKSVCVVVNLSSKSRSDISSTRKKYECIRLTA